MLANVLTGEERTLFAVIQDSSNTRGLQLLKCCARHRAEKQAVTVLLLETPTQEFCEGLPSDVLNNLTIHDYSSDPYGWNDPSKPNVCSTPISLLISDKTDTASTGLLIVDSFSVLLIAQSTSQACKQLHQLVQRDHFQLLGMLHSDLHKEVDLDLVTHLASCVLEVEQPRSEDCSVGCRLLLKRYSGKVIRKHEEVVISSGYELQSSRDIVTLATNKQAAFIQASSQPDPAANLTFNLRLSETEKQARSEVPAPYLKTVQKQDIILQKSVGEGRVFYQPDEADDFDEEDPDDDLDI